MTLKEIEKNKEELTNILKEQDAEKRLEKLQGLAKRVGASITKMVNVQTKQDGARLQYKLSNEITESEIVHNIQEALRTETMIEMCKISARNLRISSLAMLIALLAMIAAWVAAGGK